jgi:predicted XRE-type DNA-binding protein
MQECEHVVNDTIIKEAQEVLGVPKPVSKPPMRIPITKFRHGNIFVGLNMVADYDKKMQDYKVPQPRMTFIVGDMHPYLPVDAQLFKDLGKSFADLGNSIENMEFPKEEMDIEEIRAKLRALGCKIDDS